MFVLQKTNNNQNLIIDDKVLKIIKEQILHSNFDNNLITYKLMNLEVSVKSQFCFYFFYI